MLHEPRIFSPARRRGVVAPAVAILLVGLLGLTAIAVDGGYLLADRARVQAAADMAALAGAIDLFQNYTANQGVDVSGTAKTSAKDTAADNGFKDGTNGVTVTVHIPPQSGTYKGVAGYVEVIITMSQQRYFSTLFGQGNMPVQAQGGGAGATTPKGYGIIVLAPTGSNDLTTTAQGDVVVQGGDIAVDSNDSRGGTISNSGNIQANEIDFSGNPGYNTSNSGTFIGTLKSSQVPVPDPLKNLAPPSQPGASYNNVNISNLPTLGGSVPGYPTPGDPNGWTLPPGTYNNGIHISDNNSSHTYTLATGTYYFSGGGLSLSANANITSGTGGVLLYFNSGGGLSITAGGSVTLAPMTTGTYANITIYQDRSNSSQDSITGQASGSLNISGTVYVPAAKLTLTGAGGTMAVASQIICYQLVVTGSGNFNVVYSNQALAPDRNLYLVE